MTSMTNGTTSSGNPFDEFPIDNPSPQHVRHKSSPSDLFHSSLLGTEVQKNIFPNTSAAPTTLAQPEITEPTDSDKKMHIPSHSLDPAALRYIAAQLAQDKPRCATEKEQAQQAAEDHMSTLGKSPKMSTGTKKSHRRKPSRDLFQSKLMRKAVPESVVGGSNVAAGVLGLGSTLDEDPSAVKDIGSKSQSTTPTRESKVTKMKSIISLGGKAKTAGISQKKAPTSTNTSPKQHSASLSPHAPISSPRRASAATSSPSVISTGTPFLTTPLETPKYAQMTTEKSSANNSASSLRSFSPVSFSNTDPGLNIPDLSISEQHPGTSSATGGGGQNAITTDHTLRSSELDPSDFQVEIPPAEEFLVHSRVCATLSSYPIVDQNFDFGTLAGMSRMSLEAFASRIPSMSMSLSPGSMSLPPKMISSPDSSAMSSPPPLQMTFSSPSSHSNLSPPGQSPWSRDGAQLVDSHRPIVNTILECADDIVVEGFFHEIGDDERHETVVVGGDKSTHDRIEVAVFSSQKHRQFVVAYRGTTERQKKPVRNRQIRQVKETARNAYANNLHPKQPVTVFPPLRDAYFKKGLEEKIFDLLNDLSENNPFCDVVFTGHSFGAALATIGSLRYAIDHPMMRVSCHAFGSPKVGAQNFRDLVNSLPNLKVMRVEYGSDPWVFAPEGQGWVHVGHTIVLNTTLGSSTPGGTPERNIDSGRSLRNLRLSKDNNSFSEKNESVTAQAFKFDKGRKSGGGSGSGGLFKKNKKGNTDQEIRSYVQAIEQYTHRGLTWVKGYVGEDVGVGVRGKGEEKRLVC
mmetsp:Transcript_22616/g.32851  ORF Transcript_22616/g.32851 Transcript_22616/m.32851 type:complete len:799 (-) Transcript_22616:274-2670(-)